MKYILQGYFCLTKQNKITYEGKAFTSYIIHYEDINESFDEDNNELVHFERRDWLRKRGTV